MKKAAQNERLILIAGNNVRELAGNYFLIVEDNKMQL